MEAKFTHLSGDIRQPVLIVGDDPDAAGNVLYARLLPVQSIGAANLFDSPVDSPTDSVDQPAAAGADEQVDPGTIGAALAEATTTSAAADYVDNGDGTFTRNADGVRGHFGPDGFIESGGEGVTGVSWGQ